MGGRRLRGGEEGGDPEDLEQAQLREKVKVLIGGAPVTHTFAKEIGADGYGESAAVAVEKAKALLGIA